MATRRFHNDHYKWDSSQQPEDLNEPNEQSIEIIKEEDQVANAITALEEGASQEDNDLFNMEDSSLPGPATSSFRSLRERMIH